MSDDKLRNAALKLMRAASGLPLNFVDTKDYDSVNAAVDYMGAIRMLVGAHLAYRGYAAPSNASTDTPHTPDDVMDAVDNYWAAVGKYETEAERAILDAINQITHEMCEELDQGVIYE